MSFQEMIKGVSLDRALRMFLACHALSQSQDNIVLKFRSKYSWVSLGIQTLARRVLLKMNQEQK